MDVKRRARLHLDVLRVNWPNLRFVLEDSIIQIVHHKIVIGEICHKDDGTKVFSVRGQEVSRGEFYLALRDV